MVSSLAAQCFIDSCMRMRIPYTMAAMLLIEDKCISMGELVSMVSVRWFLLADGTTAMEIAYMEWGLDQYFFKADGTLSGHTIVPLFN